MTIDKQSWVLIFTSGALASILSMLIGAYQKHIEYKDNKRKRDTDDFYSKWMSAEDEVDQLRDENRKLKDQVARLKIERDKNKHG